MHRIDFLPALKKPGHVRCFQRDAALRPVGRSAALVQVDFSAQRRAPRRAHPVCPCPAHGVKRSFVDPSRREAPGRVLRGGIAQAQTFAVFARFFYKADVVRPLRRASVALPLLGADRLTAQRYGAAQQDAAFLPRFQHSSGFPNQHFHPSFLHKAGFDASRRIISLPGVQPVNRL